MIDELDMELRRAGIDGRRRRRIVAEVGDHLACDPSAPIGEPRELAESFADELGTHRMRGVTVLGFGCLALAGAVYAGALLPLLGGAAGRAHALTGSALAQGIPGPGLAGSPLAAVLGVVLVLAPQVAFVSGVLALLRVVRHRDRADIPAAETRLVLRRTVVAAAAGAVTMAALAWAAVLPDVSGHAQTGPLRAAVAAGAALLGLVLLAIAAAAVRTLRIRATRPGEAGWLLDDIDGLIPFAHVLRPWPFAVATAAAVGVAVFLAGVVASDGYDGALRGVAEAVACLLGFALLGGVLGIRPARTAATR